jgi:hypothetical protein
MDERVLMKAALLGPVAWRTPPRAYGAILARHLRVHTDFRG